MRNDPGADPGADPSGANGGAPAGGAAAGGDGNGGEGGQGGAGGGSLFAGAKADDGGQGAQGGQPGEHDWMPKKFHVLDAEGKFDAAASARKLAESYTALEAHRGPLPQVPPTPGDYKLEPPKDADGKPIDGVDVDAFTADPLYQGFAKDMHALGLTNEQMQGVVHRYLSIAPQLIAANEQLDLEEARAELGKIWKDEASLNSNIAASLKAIRGFGAEADDVPGSRKRLEEKYGRDPDFIAFAAQVASEMKEDRVPSEGIGATEADIESLQKSEAYWKATHPDHAKVKGQVEAFYARKFGEKRR